MKKLSIKEWEEIKRKLQEPKKNITQIAKIYKINRKSVYDYAWRKGWLRKNEKPKQYLWNKIKTLFKPF